MAPQAQAVSVSLKDLADGSVPLETLQQAFGPDSLGILVVTDLPPGFAQLRHAALSYALYLGNLPAAELDKLENAGAKFLTGWSRGKETLRGGAPDTLKGSFYANCAFYVDAGLDAARPAPGFAPDSFPEYLAPNRWPPEDVLPGFRPALTRLCRLIIDVAVLVARACDRFAARAMADYPGGYLERVVATSTTTKARLLHYFPQGDGAAADGGTSGTPASTAAADDWCATHVDHGCLTGLTSAMFVDEAAAPPVAAGPAGSALPPLAELPGSPDAAAGLYVRSRAGATVQVRIPRDAVAFQTGEALERITAGRFKAVPHFVRGPAGCARVARNTLAVFTQPNLDDEVDMARHLTFGEFARGVVASNTLT